MPLSLTDFRRPRNDNGRGVHGIATIGWSGGTEGLDFWIGELQALGVKWFKILDDSGDSLPLCKKLIAAGIYPVVRILRHDPPPNDSPEPNPGHMGSREEQTVKRLIDAGVLYFETNNEPNLGAEWKNGAIPNKVEDAAKLIALNWLFDARFILEAGGYPGLPAVSIGSDMDLMGALASVGRQDILLEGCWIAIHNYSLNHPLTYPDDRVNQAAASLAREEYDLGLLTRWVWWNAERGREDTIEEINLTRIAGKNTGKTVLDDHSCFREYEFFDALANKYLGRSIPILSTEGGYLVGRREDPRYPRITPQMHADLTVAMFDFMQREAPDYYFATMPWLMLPSAGWVQDAWYGNFWDRAFREGPRSNEPLPPFSVPGITVGQNLPVVAAVKAMPNLVRGAPQPRVPFPEPLPIPTLQPRPEPAPPPPPPSEENIYLVQHGDTLTAIAKKFGTTVDEIVALNGLADASRIFAGQRLIIPPQRTVPSPAPPVAPQLPQPELVYVVQRGDTLSAIARKFGLTVPTLAAANHITDPSRIFVGQRLSIPSLTPTPSAAPVDRSQPAAPSPPPAPPPPVAPRASFNLDARLNALNVRIMEAVVPRGELYWRLVRAEYQDPNDSGGNHHIFYTVIDERGAAVVGQPVLQGWPDEQIETITDATGNANIAMWASYSPDRGESGPYSAWVDGLPSDRATGLGLPLNRHVNFRLTWQRSVK